MHMKHTEKKRDKNDDKIDTAEASRTTSRMHPLGKMLKWV